MVAMPVHVKSYGVFDTPKIDPFTTTSNNYADVPVHWPDVVSEPRAYWPVDKLGGKSMWFKAQNKDLLVQILASIDDCETFPIVEESPFLLSAGSSVSKYVSKYYHGLKIQVKPNSPNQHGILTVQASGSSLLCGPYSSLVLDDVVIGDVNVLRAPQSHANIDFATTSDQTIIPAPPAGSRIRICHLLLMSGAPTMVNSEVVIKSGSTVIKTARCSSIALDFPEHCNLGTAEALVLKSTTSDRIVGGVDYYVEAV